MTRKRANESELEYLNMKECVVFNIAKTKKLNFLGHTKRDDGIGRAIKERTLPEKEKDGRW